MKTDASLLCEVLRKKEMKDAENIMMKNGMSATQGVCPVCGMKMFRIRKA